MNPIADAMEAAVEEMFGKAASADDILSLCREKQVQGFRKNAASGPLSKLVSERIGNTVYFDSTGKSGRFMFFNRDGSTISVIGRPACVDFHWRFESGEWTDLIAFYG